MFLISACLLTVRFAWSCYLFCLWPLPVFWPRLQPTLLNSYQYNLAIKWTQSKLISCALPCLIKDQCLTVLSRLSCFHYEFKDCQEAMMKVVGEKLPLLVRLIHRSALQHPLRPHRFRFLQALAPSECYSRSPGGCCSFLTQCSIHFELQAASYTTEWAKVAYTISLLTGKATEWGTAVWNKYSNICSWFDLFSEELRKGFHQTNAGRDASRGLLKAGSSRCSWLFDPVFFLGSRQ